MIWINRNASYDSFLRDSQNKRTSFCVFLYWNQVGSFGICLNLSKISIQPMYVFFAELHLFSKDGTIICLKQMDTLFIKANTYICSHLLLKIHKPCHDYCSGDCVTLSPPYYYIDSPDGDTCSVTLVNERVQGSTGGGGGWGERADGAGAYKPCSIHNRTSDKALGVDSPDGDTCSVTLVRGGGGVVRGRGLIEQVRVRRALFTTKRVIKHWE